MGSLHLCSQTVLQEFLHEMDQNSLDIGDSLQKEHRQIIQDALLSQTHDLTTHSSRLATFKKINRLMPFDNFEYLQYRVLKKRLDGAVRPR